MTRPCWTRLNPDHTCSVRHITDLQMDLPYHAIHPMMDEKESEDGHAKEGSVE